MGFPTSGSQNPSAATRQVMASYSIMHGSRTRKAATKVVRSRSERGFMTRRLFQNYCNSL